MKPSSFILIAIFTATLTFVVMVQTRNHTGTPVHKEEAKPQTISYHSPAAILSSIEDRRKAIVVSNHPYVAMNLVSIRPCRVSIYEVVLADDINQKFIFPAVSTYGNWKRGDTVDIITKPTYVRRSGESTKEEINQIIKSPS